MKDKDARSSLVEFREAIERADRDRKADITQLKSENRKLKGDLAKAQTTADLALSIAHQARGALLALLAAQDDDDDPPASVPVGV